MVSSDQTGEKFAPFDAVYETVTKRMRVYQNRLDQHKDWFEKLIIGFQEQRSLWDRSSPHELDGYMSKWDISQSRLKHLSIAAYLHIAYDLPRVIANNHGPLDLYDRYDVYVGAEHIFSEVLSDTARSVKVVGWWPGLLSKSIAVSERLFGKTNAFEVMGQWVLKLRTTAWIHGQRLAVLPDEERTEAEARLLAGMEKALEDAKTWTPLLFGKLNSPSFDTSTNAFTSFFYFAFFVDAFADPKENIIQKTIESVFNWMGTNPILAVTFLAVTMVLVTKMFFVYMNKSRGIVQNEALKEAVFADLFGALVSAYARHAFEKFETDADFNVALSVDGARIYENFETRMKINQ